MVYVLEDDKAILELVCYALQSQNIEAKGFENPLDFENALNKQIPQILVLDVMLPQKSGLEILQNLKENARTKSISVLMLSALGEEMDKVRGLELGACDYMSKPFGVMEFIARIKAILRRLDNKLDSIELDGLELCVNSHKITLDGESIELRLKEFELLSFLLQNLNRAFSREELLEIIWGYSYYKECRTIDIHIKNLREKLGKWGKRIQTIHGIGYKLNG